MSDRKIPVFATEAEEADWWFAHRHETAAEMIRASREGRLGPGSMARRAQKLRELAGAEVIRPEVLTAGK